MRYLTIRLQFAMECLRHSNQQGLGHFWAKFGEEGVDRHISDVNTKWKIHGLSYVKEIMSISSAV